MLLQVLWFCVFTCYLSISINFCIHIFILMTTVPQDPAILDELFMLEFVSDLIQFLYTDRIDLHIHNTTEILLKFALHTNNPNQSGCVLSNLLQSTVEPLNFTSKGTQDIEIYQTRLGWFFGCSLSKLCPTAPLFIRNGHCHQKLKFLELLITANLTAAA